MRRLMKLAFVSDIHELHDDIVVPPCDVLVCCGDFTNGGQPHAVGAFARWCQRVLREQPVRRLVTIAGNHELTFDASRREAAGGLREEVIGAVRASGAIYLEDEACTIEGVTFYGSPWSMRFFDWAFQIDGEEQDRAVSARIPDRVDVLITHGPPHGILDRTYDGRNVGSPALTETVARVRPRIHAFGHIHEAHGIAVRHGTTFVNACTCNARYEPVNAPVVITLA